MHTGLRRMLMYVALDVACFQSVGYFVKLILDIPYHIVSSGMIRLCINIL